MAGIAESHKNTRGDRKAYTDAWGEGMSREFLLALFLFATSISLVFGFSLLWWYDAVRVCEDNTVVRIGELALFSAMAVFSGCCLYTYLRKLKRWK